MSFDRHRIEAELALAMIPSLDMPKIAVDGLESGLDGPAIRQLAWLEKPSPFEVAEILPKACKELGLANLTVGEAAERLTRIRVAEILDANLDPLLCLKELQDIWTEAHHPRETKSIGTLYDEIDKHPDWSESKTRDWVTKELQHFLMTSR